ncbi:MAG: hypothetical protein HC806_05260 [Anaerolineae bacterium]|nr:hypothetical protein [Anaerolineae bacterium]
MPTITPLPSLTPIPVSPTTSVPCNAASFVADVTVADSTWFNPGIEFTKIWRIKNVGSCAWTTQYALVFSNGERMSGKKTNFLTKTVNPGETVDISVLMEAPAAPKTYQGLWLLQSPDGKLFGVGEKYDVPVSVKIIVIAVEANQFYNFAVNACAAKWTNENGALPARAKGMRAGLFAFWQNQYSKMAKKMSRLCGCSRRWFRRVGSRAVIRQFSFRQATILFRTLAVWQIAPNAK